ncbi:MAG: DUF3793 family protein [Clostridiales bacterium]|nr:DUF3793 family protein [Clostridiales bacterium]
MSEEIIIRYCSPTLAGLKTGNMFTCYFSDEKEVYSAVRNWNLRLGKKGVRFLPLCLRGNRALIYVYRPSFLSRDLQRENVCSLLMEHGYGTENQGECVARLRRRFDEGSEFPHEIGLFLGYPPEDVRGFIEKGADSFKYAGLWKVYGDVDSALKTFAKYKKCARIYKILFSKGRSVDRLTVVG